MGDIRKLDPNDRHSIALEVAMDLDREYFRQHPEATEYTRQPVPHEYPDFVYESGEVVSVTVVKLGTLDGVAMRTRVPLQMKAVPIESKDPIPFAGKKKHKKRR